MLKRELGLAELTLYGVGMIVGAGIYALIGKVCGLAGNGVWLSFILSSFLAIFTGLSYAQLGSMLPKDAAEYEYVKSSTKNEFLSIAISWLMLGSMLLSATTVALGFAGYLAALLGGSIELFAAFSIVIFTLINYMGMNISAKINDVLTLLEILGLVIIILGTIFALFTSHISVRSVDYFDFPLKGVFAGAVLAFFAFIGFGSITKIAEETKSPEKTIPKAILLSIFITTLLYIGVALSAVTLASPKELYVSKEPAALIAEKINPWLRFFISFVALFSTGNTILLILISSSRMFYGLASRGVFPRFLAKIDKKTSTPFYAVFLSGIVSTLLLMVGDIRTVAEVTNVWIFICYFFVNLSAVLLYKEAKEKAWFKVPLAVRNIPIPSVLGMIASLLMTAYVFLQSTSSILAIALTFLLLLFACIFYTLKKRGF